MNILVNMMIIIDQIITNIHLISIKMIIFKNNQMMISVNLEIPILVIFKIHKKFHIVLIKKHQNIKVIYKNHLFK